MGSNTTTIFTGSTGPDQGYSGEGEQREVPPAEQQCRGINNGEQGAGILRHLRTEQLTAEISQTHQFRIRLPAGPLHLDIVAQKFLEPWPYTADGTTSAASVAQHRLGATIVRHQAADQSTSQPRQQGQRQPVLRDRRKRQSASVLDKGLQVLAARRMPQLFQGLGFDLTDAFAGHREALPHLLQGMIAADLNAVAHAQHLLFTRRQ